MDQCLKPYKGLFITLEGGEGAGKTLLADRLSRYFEKEGYCVFKTREPGNTPLSEEMRRLVLNQKEIPICEMAELLLYLVSRAQNLHDNILPALHEGKVVLCDRFNDSSVAYQGAARKLGMECVEKICSLVTDEIEPDCTLLLDLDPEEGLKRVMKQRKQTDRLESEALQFHKEVRSAYFHLADKHPDRICIVDASLPIEEVEKLSIEAIQPHLLLKP